MTDEPILKALRNIAAGDIAPWTVVTEPGYQHGYWGLGIATVSGDSQYMLDLQALRASEAIYGIELNLGILPTVAPDRWLSGEENATARMQRYLTQLQRYQPEEGDEAPWTGKGDLTPRSAREFLAAYEQLKEGGWKQSQMAGTRLMELANMLRLAERHLREPREAESAAIDLTYLSPTSQEAEDALAFLAHADTVEQVLFAAISLITRLLPEGDLGLNALMREVRAGRLAPDNWEKRQDLLPIVLSLWASTVKLDKNAVTPVNIVHQDKKLSGTIACDLWSSDVEVMPAVERRVGFLFSEYFSHFEGHSHVHVREGLHRASIIFDRVPPPAIPVVQLQPEEPIRSFAPA